MVLLQNLPVGFCTQSYIRDMQFCPIDWAAPGRAAFGQGKETIESDDIAVHQRNRIKKTPKHEKPLQGKTISDVVESLIGTCSGPYD